MDSVFGQVRRGPENDYAQAMGMLQPRGSKSPSWEDYQGLQSGQAGKTAQSAVDAAKGLFGYDQTQGNFGDQTSISPEAPFNQQTPSQGQIAPQTAMAMLNPQRTQQPNWSDWGGGGGGGGGGMDMGSMASMAMAFL